MKGQYPDVVDPFLVGRRLNLGCGAKKLDGFVNADLHGTPDIQFDARQPWPIEPGSLDAVFAHHVLEHFSGSDVLKVFWEIGNALRPGGHLVAATPYGSAELQYSNPFHQQWFTVGSFVHYTQATFDGPSVGMQQDIPLHTWTPVCVYLVPDEDFAHLSADSEEFKFALRHYLNVVREMYFVLRRERGN